MDEQKNEKNGNTIYPILSYEDHKNRMSLPEHHRIKNIWKPYVYIWSEPFCLKLNKKQDMIII